MIHPYSQKTILRLLPSTQASYETRFMVSERHLEVFSPVRKILLRSALIKNLRGTLVDLGIPRNRFAGIKLLSIVSAFLIASVLLVLGGFGLAWHTFFILFIALVAGWIMPELYVIDRVQNRRSAINREFPKFLDLLRLYTASPGFENFKKAFTDIAVGLEGVLGQELTKTLKALRFTGFLEFLEEFERRFSLPEARELTTTIRVVNAYGGGVKTRVSQLAEQAQSRRLRQAKLLGQKSSVGLLVPLLFFHFPVALILFILPFAYSIMQALGTQ